MRRYKRVQRAGEAIFWDGTNTNEIIEWVQMHPHDQARYNPREDERGYWEVAEDESWPAVPGAITILTPNQMLILKRREYIFRDDAGEYSVMGVHEFNHEYEIGA